MKPFWRRTTAGILAAVMLTGTIALAEDTVTSNQIDELKDKVQQAQTQAQQAQQGVQNNMDAKAQAQLQAQLILSQINGLHTAQEQIHEQITDYEQQVIQKQQTYSQRMSTYKSQLQAMQVMHDSGSVAMLMNASNLYDLLTFSSSLQQISSYTNQLLTTLNTQKQELEQLKASLENERSAAQANQQQLESTRKEYQQQIQSLDKQINQGTAEQISYEAEYQMRKEELQKAEAQLEQQIADALAQEMAKPAPTPTPAPTAEPTPTPAPEDGSSQPNASQPQPQASDAPPTPAPTPDPTPEPTPAPPPPSAGFSPTWPVPGYSKISTQFGEVIYGDPHYAIDIPAPQGTPIVAACEGKVLIAGWNASYGNWALINHSDGMSTVYAHMADGSLAVRAGQTVTKGQYIGGVGKTGFADGNHLHFEVRKNGQKVDPLQYVSP